MKTPRLLLLMMLLLGVAFAKNNAVPYVSQPLVPMTVRPGSSQFTLTVNGAGFSSAAVVTWNGATRVTSFISNTQVQAQISAADVANPGTAFVNVVNPSPVGGVSNTVFLPIQTPAPFPVFAAAPGFSGSGVNLAGDFNNDGILDLAVAGQTSVGFFINTYLGNGDGTFATAFPNHSVTPVTSMASGDFEKSGYLDLAVSDRMANTTIFSNHGSGIFVQKEVFLTPPYGIAIADFNRDGNLDLLTTGFNTEIYLGNGDGTFADPQLITAPDHFGRVPAVGDFNGDGKLDVAIADGWIYVLLGNGDGTFQPPIVYKVPYDGVSATVADINGDGKLDIVTNGISILLGNGDGTFTNAGGVSITGDYHSQYQPPLIADFNGDGKLDMAVLSDAGIELLSGNGDGTFQNPVVIAGDGAATLVLGDFNNDGKLDLVGTSLYLQIPISLSPTSIDFGTQNVGSKSKPQNVTTINVGASTLTLTGITFSGSDPKDFTEKDNCGSSLPAGSNCQIAVTFQPHAGGSRSATLNFNYQGLGNPQTVALSGLGAISTITLKPSKLTYATQLVGTSSRSKTATLTNTGTVPVNISNISTTTGFTQTNNCPSSLPTSSSCQIQVEFAPTKKGLTSGTLSVTDDAKGSPQTVALSGIGTVVKLSPLGINFGQQKVGTQSSPAPIQLTNVGKTSLNISQISIKGTNAGDFTQTNNCGHSVPAGGSCTINVVFDPQATGQRSANVQISDDGGASPQRVALTGTGT